MVTLLKMQPRYSQSSRESVTPSSRTSPLASYKEVPSPQDLTLGSHSSECPHLSRPRAVSSFSSDLVRGVHGAARRETRETRAAARLKEKRASPVSGLQSRAWSFVCLGRFARRTKKKERLLLVYHLSPSSSFLSRFPYPPPLPPPIHQGSRFGPIPSPDICDIPRLTYHVIDSLPRGVLTASSALLIESFSLKVPVRK